MKVKVLLSSLIALLTAALLFAAACSDDDDGGDEGGGDGPSSTATQDPNVEPTVVKVGFTGSLTGPAAEYGGGAAEGMKMAFEDAGVVDVGGVPHVFELVELDDQYDPATGASNAQRLVEEHNVQIAATQGGTISVAAEPIFSEAGIIQFHYGGATAYLGPDKPLAFRTALTYGDAFPIVWPWLVENYTDIETVSLIHPNDETGQSQAAVEEQAIQDQGLTLLTTEYIARDLTDFYPVLTGLLDNNPDAISFALPPGQQTGLIRQMKELGYEGYILAGALSQSVVDDLGADIEDVVDPVCVTRPVTDEAADILDRWVEERDSPPPASLLDGYLMGVLMIEAAKGAGEIDSFAMADALHEVDLTDTIFGQMAWHEVAGSNNAMVHDVSVCEVQDGELTQVGVATVG